MMNWLISEKLLIKKKFLKMKIQIKRVDIVEKLLDFSKQQKGRGIKLLTSRQMFQRLPIELAQLKAGNTFENLLNVI